MDNTSLGFRLLKFRKLHNYTQKEIGRYLNIERQTYSNYERGVRMPDSNTLARLAKLYHISIDELIAPLPDTAAEIHSFVHEGNAPFDGKRPRLTETERQIIADYRSLPASGKDNFLLYLRFLKAESDKF